VHARILEAVDAAAVLLDEELERDVGVVRRGDGDRGAHTGDRQQRVLRWVAEGLGLTLGGPAQQSTLGSQGHGAATDALTPMRASTQQDGPERLAGSSSVDIKSFVAQKKRRFASPLPIKAISVASGSFAQRQRSSLARSYWGNGVPNRSRPAQLDASVARVDLDPIRDALCGMRRPCGLYRNRA
jgi:hypothetical protein